MPTRDEIFPSKYLKASDLGGEAVVATIISAEPQILKNPEGEETRKVVLAFKGLKKTLPLNQINWGSVCEITGEDDSDDWPGHKVELFPSRTEMKGKAVDCIRIRGPQQAELPVKKPKKKKPASSDDDLNDEIPFSS
jgi:hypothetical protein